MMFRRRLAPRERLWLMVAGFAVVALLSATLGALFAAATDVSAFTNRHF